jgi:hypothetical protein
MNLLGPLVLLNGTLMLKFKETADPSGIEVSMDLLHLVTV